MSYKESIELSAPITRPCCVTFNFFTQAKHQKDEINAASSMLKGYYSKICANTPTPIKYIYVCVRVYVKETASTCKWNLKDLPLLNRLVMPIIIRDGNDDQTLPPPISSIVGFLYIFRFISLFTKAKVIFLRSIVILA